MSKLLQVKNLSISIGDKPIVKSVSFDLVKNRNLAIIGESGAGKSMTIYAISSLLPPKSTRIEGEILFEDQVDILQLGKDRRKFTASNIGIILQDSMNSLNPYESIEKQMLEAIRFHNRKLGQEEARKQVQELLDNVGFDWTEDKLKKYPHEYSGGMRQRISIALALTSHPKILILDEPTTALDAINQRTFILFLKELCREKDITLIYISHNLGLASELCQDVVVMDKGELVEAGSLDQVFQDPQAPSTQALVYHTKNLMGGGSHE